MGINQFRQCRHTSAGDLVGNGECEIVLHQVGRGRDNSQSGFTSEPILEAYKLNEAILWCINFGKIFAKVHTTLSLPFSMLTVAETVMPKSLAKQRMEPDHGNGRVVGEAHADSRNARGYILDGPEYLPIPDGGPVYAWQPSHTIRR